MAAKKWVFCKEYSEVAFLCNGTDRHETPAKKVHRYALSKLIRGISKIVLRGGDFAPNRHFWVVLTGLRLTRLQLTGYVCLLR